MVAYSYQRRFIDPMLAGIKGGTIRLPRPRHARPGEEIQNYVGMRTKACQLVMRAPCVEVVPFVMLHGSSPRKLVAVVRNGKAVDNRDEFAVADGFKDWDEMMWFWRQEHSFGIDLMQFTGLHICWDPKRAFGGMKVAA